MAFIEYDNVFPTVMNDLEKKILAQSLRVSMNKALGAATKIAKKELRNRYNLPSKGKLEKYNRPPIPTQMEHKPIRGVGGVKQKVPAKIYAETKDLGLIRFLNEENQKPANHKGIKNSQRKQIKLSVGRSTKTRFKSRFVAKVQGGNLHVFRRIKGSKSPNNPKKEKLALQRLASVYDVLSNEKIQEQMLKAALEKMDAVWANELEKRIEQAINKGGVVNVRS